MIITMLNGGLGNQLFQYAMGRSIALKNKTDLKLDLRWFRSIKGTTERKYELHHFNIPAEEATEADIKKITEPYSNPLLKFFFLRYQWRLPPHLRNVVEERQFHFDENMLKVRNNAYLSGYWQSEKYFRDIRPTLLQDLSPRQPLEGKNLELAGEISRTESVSIHVRRADYVSDPKISEVHGVCSESYYDAAISFINDKVSNPVYFIFSDDIEWCRQHLKINREKHFIDHNTGDKSYSDLLLMRLCRHNIIANSSFSWWGAWLNDNPGKIAVAPAKWFNAPGKDAKDVIPDEWVKL